MRLTNCQLEESLDDANFMIEGEGEFESMYLDDIEDDMNPGVTRADDINTPSPEDYDDMNTEDRPDEDDEEAVDKYLTLN